MKFCTNCGSQLPDDAAFCGNCGTKQAELIPQSNQLDSPIQQPMQQPQYQQQAVYQQPMRQQYPQQQQGYAQPMQPQYPQQQGYAQPIQPQYPQQQGYEQPMQSQYPQQQGYAQPVQPQYPQQPGYQQPMQQQYPQYPHPGQYQSQGLENAPFNPKLPTIRFIWPKAKSYMLLFSWTPWLNNLNVEINGMKQTPWNGIKFKNGLIVDVPLTSAMNKIECWLTTPVIKKKINIYTKIIDINLEPSASYIVEIKNPMMFYLFGFASLIKYRIKDIMGNILFEG